MLSTVPAATTKNQKRPLKYHKILIELNFKVYVYLIF